MTETEVREILAKLNEISLSHGRARLMPADRAIQTAKSIGSSWPSDRVNLIYMYPDHYSNNTSGECYRMVIQ